MTKAIYEYSILFMISLWGRSYIGSVIDQDSWIREPLDYTVGLLGIGIVVRVVISFAGLDDMFFKAK